MFTDSATSLVYRAPGTIKRAGSITLSDGVKREKFTKDLIRVGEYVKASTNQAFSITPEKLANFAATFASMKAAGVKVPVPVGHTNDPEMNRGYAEDIYVDGDTLYATIELIGEDAIKLADRTEVSVCMSPELIDGKGTKYTDVIEHVAIVTDPVISGQGAWVKIAASRGGNDKKAETIKLSTGAMTMDWKELAGMLGIQAEGMDDAALAAAIKAKVTALMGAGKTAQTQASRITELEGQLTASRAGAIPDVDEDALEQSAENIGLKLDGLQKDAKLSKAVCEDLKSIMCGNSDGRKTRRVMLSMKAGKAAGLTGEKSLANLIIDALAKNDPKELGEKSRGQSLALSRANPEGNGGQLTDEQHAAAAQKRADEINASRGFAKSK